MRQQSTEPVAHRLAELDFFKTLLLSGMVLAHTLLLLGSDVTPNGLSVNISVIINLITFSGFMLAFGIGVGFSAKTTRTKPLARRIRPVIWMLLAVYASSLAYVTLVEKRPITARLLGDLFSMSELFGYSEFLATFFVLYLAIAVARPLLVWIGTTPWLLLAAAVAGLATTLITTSVDRPLLATLIGSNNYPSFPLLPYLPWFLIGIWIGADGGKIQSWYILPAVAATTVFFWNSFMSGGYPARFPPGILWITGAAVPLLACLVLAQRIDERLLVSRLLMLPGRHVLVFLIVSNLTLFGLRYCLGRPIHRLTTGILVSMVLMLAFSLLAMAIDAVRGIRSAPLDRYSTRSLPTTASQVARPSSGRSEERAGRAPG